MTLGAFDAEARVHGLTLRGALHPPPDATLPADTRTLILLGPDEPRFWPMFSGAPEFLDGAADPLDRWSKRVIGTLAREWGGTAIFPSDGPPYPPFIAWAQGCATIWASPVGLLVHHEAGLWVSFRGAVALPDRHEIPAAIRPCDRCAGQPCTTACPVGALAPGQNYDVGACRAHVASDAGRACREIGCLARRACPASAALQRPDAQAAFHMAAFLGR
ncbi:ferredoxin [Thalassococcus sp. CAU 1522]|uniref:Ferredoxin n=1 Tax=Thalassococcus arenae TaxID=2851652 RepID=A0ABS6N781_9RHOB|nr:ferredoxin [Thalassococcus arenae]MBV2359881.1 ferredoxin [Thalassococcus arenae]